MSKKQQTLKLEDYVNSVAKATGQTKKVTREVLKEFMNQFSENTVKGKASQFSGVGKTEIRHVEAAVRRNPATGEPVQVEAHKKAKFIFSGKIRNALRGIEA